jgi:hypothetical protein
MARRLTLVLGVVIVLAPLSVAQVRGSCFQQSPQVIPGYAAPLTGHHHLQSAFPRGYVLGSLPYFYDEYAYSPEVAKPAPREVPVEIHSAIGPELTVKATPLLIELQGDRYVRYGGGRYGAAPEPRQTSRPATENSERQPSERETPAHPALSRSDSTALAPTVLVYRDGHREEIPDYAIIGRVIYAHTNDWQTGYASKSIPLSAVDIAATMKANREQGVRFFLPGGPNEVVTRP